MKTTKSGKILRACLFTLMGIALLCLASLLCVYSQWFQDRIVSCLIDKVNDGTPGRHIELDRLQINFPLDVSIDRLVYIEDYDTLVAARSLKTDVALLPLFDGRAELRNTVLNDGFYRIGTPDSAMYMRINAGYMKVEPSTVTLATMDIDLSDVHLQHGCVAMALRPDTLPSPTESSENTMKIRLRHASLDDFTYRLSMVGVIDSLGTRMQHAEISDGLIDLAQQTINVKHFDVKGMNAAYIAPDEAALAEAAVLEAKVPPDTAYTPPWIIKIENIDITDAQGLYTTRGVVPVPGFDPEYIAAQSMTIKVQNFYNCATTLNVPFTSIIGTERSGVQLNASGILDIDSVALRLCNFKVSTPVSNLNVDGMMGMLGDITTDPDVPFALKTNGYMGVTDLRKMFPSYASYIATLPVTDRLEADIDVNGSMRKLDIATLRLGVNRFLSINADGTLANITDTKKMAAKINIHGNIADPAPITEIIGKNAPYTIPPLTLDGYIDYANASANAHLKAVTKNASLALDGRYNSNIDDYDFSLDARDFPVQAFMPDMGVGAVTATIDARGRGFDFFNKATTLDANIDIPSLVYDGYRYTDISGQIALSDGDTQIDLSANAQALKADISANGNLVGSLYDWHMDIDAPHADLYALHFADAPMSLSLDMQADASLTPKYDLRMASIKLASLSYTDSVTSYHIDNVRARLDATDSVTNISLSNRDLYTFVSTPSTPEVAMSRLSASMTQLDSLISRRQIDIPSLQKALPAFVLDINAGNNNFLTEVLSESDISFKHLALEASNDSLINLNGSILALQVGETRLDTVKLDMAQEAQKLNYALNVCNRPGTLDEWANIKLDGNIGDNRMYAHLTQHNISGQQGFDIGASVEFADSAATLRISPLIPRIGYKLWTVNYDNFLRWDFNHRHLDANLHMKSAGSSLNLFTEHIEGMHNEDLVLQVDNIQLADWITINPFAPPIRGGLSADMRLNYDGAMINGKGNIALNDFYYGKQRVASLLADINVSTNTSGTIRAEADLSIDGKKAMTLAGALNDSTATSPFNLDFSMVRFPMSIVNPFLPSGTAQLSGVLNGTMRISGDADRPVFDGHLEFDSTAVKLALTGTSYRFSNVQIPVTNNVVRFDRFSISGVNENPLYINGTVDISSLMSPGINLSFNADNMQIVNTSRASRGADVFGKAFISLNGKVRGNMSFLNVDANLSLLSGTNVTYVMTDAASVIESQSTGDMVKFVNLRDTTQVIRADSLVNEGMLMNINAMLNINSGTTINVYLSTDGKNKAVIKSQGSLNYTQQPMNDGRLTGRINLNSGYVAYSPPLMSEVLFNFNEGSYVAFNGDIMNPLLNLHATDNVRANITQQGQNSRIINFDVGLDVTGSFENMNVAFDLSTDDDITVANELQSMTPEQRANQAMNLLLYKTYTAGATKGNANLSGNLLYSFLTSQLNSWMANTVKGVDISFGIDQYNSTTDGATSSTMSYSYQVSKSLFNDRFKIVVGGNYNTDDDADENLSQNLINNISFEYFLNKNQTMLIRLFRHTGYESILEGEVTQTGVGFVYKRKVGSLRNLFRRSRSPRTTPSTIDTPADASTSSAQTTTSADK